MEADGRLVAARAAERFQLLREMSDDPVLEAERRMRFDYGGLEQASADLRGQAWPLGRQGNAESSNVAVRRRNLASVSGSALRASIL